MNDPLSFSLAWAGSFSGEPRLTTATLTVMIGDVAIWPVEGAPEVFVEIQADDLLSYLTEHWKPLILRQTYPMGLRPERPSLLGAEADRRWSGQPIEAVEREDLLVRAFEEAHDVSKCFAGQFGLPSLWLMRRTDRMLVDTEAKLHAVAFYGACRALTVLGDQIADRLRSSGDQRWSDLLKAWTARDQGNPEVLLAWSASLDLALARHLADAGVLSAPHSVGEAANDSDELRIAARMASALPPEQTRQVVELAKQFGHANAPKLDALAVRTDDYINRFFTQHRAYEQGEAAANFVRDELGLSDVQYADIFLIFAGCGAALRIEPTEPATLYALAVWGSKHGPAVLLNSSKLRAGKGKIERDGAARVNLAHELCHLLLDRGHAFTAVEILNTQMPNDMEQRAKAFAGELLLPARTAAELWERSRAPRSKKELRSFLGALCSKYGVTTSVAAWKLEHGLHRRDIDLRVQLDAVAPSR